MESRKTEKKQHIKQHVRLSFVLQLILNISLVLLAVTLSILMIEEIIYFVQYAISLDSSQTNYELLERILIFFLYFEFIALIVKYFQEDYHFPLRYFLYIGITAMVRLIIVYHDNAMQTLLYTCSILVLVISYYIISSAASKKDKF
ncbi:phosphate-starvation-inducible protein PsiE [Niallia sp. NCCP-28]|uniref:phosphate-starvation-inducible protein PsiE n=1 Tax=Niallia sp. NCCP-28 TaxID=2934712 RepID=UPI002085DD62|nr:phosphate-starvation-inducible protein PsiE [Niallia sp. NCCP-28]GKU82197.1 protein PsiE [Niallia sp. NCCP-28]